MVKAGLQILSFLRSIYMFSCQRLWDSFYSKRGETEAASPQPLVFKGCKEKFYNTEAFYSGLDLLLVVLITTVKQAQKHSNFSLYFK